MISIKGLNKSYGTQKVLKDINYQFPTQGLVCLFGASGCGKSTLLNLLAGFDCDYEGEIIVGDVCLNQLNSKELCEYRRNHICFIFQNYHLLSGLTVLQNMMLSNENEEIALDLLEKLSIQEKAYEKVENLSGGQKQRVAIARALMKNPQIMFADEPTGALDRNASKDTMQLLKELSKERLVIVVTHDTKTSEYADEIIQFKDEKLVSNLNLKNLCCGVLWKNAIQLKSLKKQAQLNFKIHLKRYFRIALAISIGIVAFMLSVSSSNLMQQSISDFQTKNTAFNNGYIKEDFDDTLFQELQRDERIENVYYQYVMKDIQLIYLQYSENMHEKYPMPKTSESLSYGIMPRMNKNEIALTPSLAKKFSNELSQLIGKNITIKVGNDFIELTVSGIYNAAYDDFFISSDLEVQLYKGIESNPYSISYDVKSFDEIVNVSRELEEKGIVSVNASNEVESFTSTFKTLQRLFMIVSILIFIMGYFLSATLLWRLQTSRYSEIGLLSALGYSQKSIAHMIQQENKMLTMLAVTSSVVLLSIAYMVDKIADFNLQIGVMELILCLCMTFVIMSFTGFMMNQKLIKIEPAKALRM